MPTRWDGGASRKLDTGYLKTLQPLNNNAHTDSLSWLIKSPVFRQRELIHQTVAEREFNAEEILKGISAKGVRSSLQHPAGDRNSPIYQVTFEPQARHYNPCRGLCKD